MSFITDLETAFNKNRNPENAISMAKYMKNLFSFYGIKAEQRRTIFKEVCKANKEELTQNSREIAWKLINKEFRELHYCGIEILTNKIAMFSARERKVTPRYGPAVQLDALEVEEK